MRTCVRCGRTDLQGHDRNERLHSGGCRGRFHVTVGTDIHGLSLVGLQFAGNATCVVAPPYPLALSRTSIVTVATPSGIVTPDWDA